MQSPAEVAGRSAALLARRVGRALQHLPDASLREVTARLERAALERRVVYVRHGAAEPVRVLVRPIVATREQLDYVHAVSLQVHGALKRLPDAYLGDPRVRDVLRLPPDEERWLVECWGPSHRRHNPVFGRLDAVTDFATARWRETLVFLEPNMSGIGGLHKAPTCEQMIEEIVVPLLVADDPALDLERGHDMRDLLLQEVLDHVEGLGLRAEHLCLVEPKYERSGPDEQEVLARYLFDRYGMRSSHADPSELTLRGGEVLHEGARVDVAYRDYAVSDLLELARGGVDVAPMRALLCENRVVSSIAAELDQKACFELFTDPELAERHFDADERDAFRRHVPWTRLIGGRRTTLPNGASGDLCAYVRRARETLVLKPNRSYGGADVVLGRSASAAAWDAALERALAGPERWVVQRLAPLPAIRELPAARSPASDRRRARPASLFLVLGFAPTRHGVAVLGRASSDRVVNVARGGALCAVLVGHLHGERPSATAQRASGG